MLIHSFRKHLNFASAALSRLCRFFLTCKYFCMGWSTKVAVVPFLHPPPSIYSPTPRDWVLQRGRELRAQSQSPPETRFLFFQTPLPALCCRLRTVPKLPHAADSYDRRRRRRRRRRPRRRRRRRRLCLCPMHGNGGGATAGEEEERLMRQDPPLPLFPPLFLPPKGGNCGSDTLRWWWWSSPDRALTRERPGPNPAPAAANDKLWP